MKVEKIDHIAIIVEDLEKAREFFADLFETEYVGPREVKGVDIRNLRCPLGIELITSLSPDGPTARTLASRGEGVAMVLLQGNPLPNGFHSMLSTKVFGEKAEVIELFLTTNHGILSLRLSQLMVRDLFFKVCWKNTGGARALRKFLFRSPYY